MLAATCRSVPSDHTPPAVAATHLRVVSSDALVPAPRLEDSQSPSLRVVQAGGWPACEMKFLLHEELARQVEERLAPRLSLDPHAEPDPGNGYHIRTLYCDTPRLDVFHRVGRYRLFKFRLRQYGASPKVFLERKSKRGHVVRKRRSTIPLDQLVCFADRPPAVDWEGGWYYRQLARNRFAPVCLIGYDRMAYFGSCSEGPLRLTFDRQIYGGLTNDWSLTPPAATQPILTGLVVCEFKFRGTLPAIYKSVIEALHLSPCGVSKYRHCIQSTGMGKNGSAEHA